MGAYCSLLTKLFVISLLTCPQLTNIFLYYFSSLVLATQRTLLLRGILQVINRIGCRTAFYRLKSEQASASSNNDGETLVIWLNLPHPECFHKYCLTNDRTWLYMVYVAVCGFSVSSAFQAQWVEKPSYLCVQYLAQDMPSTLLRALFFFSFFRRRIGLVP